MSLNKSYFFKEEKRNSSLLTLNKMYPFNVNYLLSLWFIREQEEDQNEKKKKSSNNV